MAVVAVLPTARSPAAHPRNGTYESCPAVRSLASAELTRPGSLLIEVDSTRARQLHNKIVSSGAETFG